MFLSARNFGRNAAVLVGMALVTIPAANAAGLLVYKSSAWMPPEPTPFPTWLPPGRTPAGSTRATPPRCP